MRVVWTGRTEQPNGTENLWKRWVRYLRYQCCGKEFSERKRTVLWNTKVAQDKAMAMAEHLGEGCSLKATARLVKVNASVVSRLNGKLGEHGAAFHDERVFLQFGSQRDFIMGTGYRVRSCPLSLANKMLHPLSIYPACPTDPCQRPARLHPQDPAQIRQP